MDFDLNTPMENLHCELDKIVTLHRETQKENLVFWNKQDQTFVFFPRKTQYLIAYSVGACSFLLSVALPGIIVFLMPVPVDNRNFLIVFVPTAATVFFGIGIYSCMMAARIGFVMLDIKNKTVHLQKIGTFSKREIAAITIRANLWTERYRSHVRSLLSDETFLEDGNVIKNATVGIRFHKPIFLGFRVTPLMNYKHFRDAKSFQRALANFFECQLVDL
ncbi:MAG: hypothetical protein AAGI69_21760 [Cyanobacteria bacterium P01_H01_bin.21]